MSKISARNTLIFCGGYETSGRTNTATLNMSAEAPEITCFGSDNRERLSFGIKDAEMTFNGYFDASASKIDEVLASLLSGSTYYGLYHNRSSNAPGREFGGVLTEYNIDESVEAAAAISATVSGSSPVFFTNIIGGLAELSAGNTNPFTAGSAQEGAASGSVIAVFRVIDIDRTAGDEELSASFQDSADGNTWYTLYEFTAASSPGTEQHMTTSVSADAYRRFYVKFAGTASFTASAMMASGSKVS